MLCPKGADASIIFHSGCNALFDCSMNIYSTLVLYISLSDKRTEHCAQAMYIYLQKYVDQ